VLVVGAAGVGEPELARGALDKARATRSSSDETLRLTVDFGIDNRRAAPLKLPAWTTRAKTTISFRSIVPPVEQLYPKAQSSATSGTSACLVVQAKRT
jgi:hypothetical protein